MSRSFKSIILIFAILMQTTILPHFTVFSVIPNYVFVLMIAISIINEDSESVVFAAVTGFLLDLFTGAPVGLNTLLYMYISIAVIVITGRIYIKRIKVVAPVCFIASVIYELVFGILSTLLRNGTFYPLAIVSVVLPVALINTVIFIPVYMVLSRVRFEKKRKGIKYECQI